MNRIRLIVALLYIIYVMIFMEITGCQQEPWKQSSGNLGKDIEEAVNDKRLVGAIEHQTEFSAMFQCESDIMWIEVGAQEN